MWYLAGGFYTEAMPSCSQGRCTGNVIVLRSCGEESRVVLGFLEQGKAAFVGMGDLRRIWVFWWIEGGRRGRREARGASLK